MKSANHWRAFETAFEVYFSMRGPQFSPGRTDLSPGGSDSQGEETGEGHDTEGAGGGEPVSSEEIAAMVLKAIREGDRAMLNAAARLAVARYSAIEPGRPVGGTYYLYRTLRGLDLEGVLGRLLSEARAEAGSEPADGRRRRARRGRAEGPAARAAHRARGASPRGRVQVPHRAAESGDRSRDPPPPRGGQGRRGARPRLRKPLPEDVEFMHATREELVSMRKAIQPLTRKLATRLARKRRHLRRGALDFRATMRHSLSYGGVPVEPRYKHPHQAKPEIWVIADVSGSVAAFARFTLHLVHAISSQFSRVRSFVFIDGIDEVTGIFERSETVTEAISRVNVEADVVWADGHSDYGHALTTFYERWGDEIGPKASILLLGDARNNYHASQAWVIGELRRRARRVFWLNPEPRSYWGSGDSIVEQYAQHCDAAYECRNLRQLEAFVEHLA